MSIATLIAELCGSRPMVMDQGNRGRGIEAPATNAHCIVSSPQLLVLQRVQISSTCHRLTALGHVVYKSPVSYARVVFICFARVVLSNFSTLFSIDLLLTFLALSRLYHWCLVRLPEQSPCPYDSHEHHSQAIVGQL
jgi:hypothetical protein